MKEPNSGRRGFTLIELLIVVAIIAVLAALLLPALQKAKDQSKRAVCMTHLKQVSVALLMMADDNDGWLNGINAAATANNDASIPLTNYWNYCVTNYLGHSNALVNDPNTACPAKAHPDNNTPYGANMAFVGNYSTPMHSLKEVTHTDRIFLVADCYTTFAYSPSLFSYTCGYPTYNIAIRHSGAGLNFVFVDGHGEWIKSDGLIPSGPASQWWLPRNGGNVSEATLWGWPYVNWVFGGWFGE